jgi:hypothetical protein
MRIVPQVMQPRFRQRGAWALPALREPPPPRVDPARAHHGVAGGFDAHITEE